MLDSLDPLFARVGGVRRAATLGVGLLAIALIFGVSRWATRPVMVPIVSGAPLETIDPVTQRLTQEGIVWELGRGGADVMVAANDLPRARVALAKEGGSVAGKRGLEIFDDPSYTMTDYTQRINYRRGLEGELERTIGQMSGVAMAKVSLAIRETSTFRRTEEKPSASVTLTLQGNEQPSAEAVRGISHLVAASVGMGLDAEHVTVVDNSMRLLTRPADESPLGLTSRQLEVQRDVEGHLQRKAADLVGQVVGRDNARVEVTAAMNFDRLERTTSTVDPERQVTATEQKSEIVPGAQGGAAQSQQAIRYENSTSTESFAQSIGNLQRLTVSVLVNERLVGEGDSARFQPRSPLELARLDTLVRAAVGFDSTRGDVVRVISVQFPRAVAAAAVPDEGPTLLQRVQSSQGLILNVVALVMAFVIGFLSLKAMKAASVSRAAGTALAAAGAAGVGNALPAPYLRDEASYALPSAPRFDPAALRAGSAGTLSDDPRHVQMTPELAALQANQETKNRVIATVDQQPEIATKLIRAWMKEG
jgi:flagellar M-ring protein FliF